MTVIGKRTLWPTSFSISFSLSGRGSDWAAGWASGGWPWSTHHDLTAANELPELQCVPCWLWYLTTEEKAAYCLKLPMRIWLWYNIQHLWAGEASAAEYQPWKERSSETCQIRWEQTGRLLPDTVTETVLWGGCFFNPEWEVQVEDLLLSLCECPQERSYKEAVPLAQQQIPVPHPLGQENMLLWQGGSSTVKHV